MWEEVESPRMPGSLDVNSSTGFSFDNCIRNRELVREGIEGPNVVSTGTTIVGLIYRDGVMLAGDSRSTAGSIISFKTTRKIQMIQDNIYAGGAGIAADISALTALTEAQMNLHRMNTGDRLVPVRCANQFMKHVLYRFSGVLGASFIIGGVDKDGAHLYCTRFDGTTDILPYATIGSGGMAAMGVLETRFRCRMSESSARRLIKDAVHCGMANDLYSGNESHICIIRKDYTVDFEIDSTEDDCVDRDFAEIRIKPGSTSVLSTVVHWVADMYDKIVYTLPRDCDSWNPVPRHQQGEVEIWRNGRGPKKLFVPPGETGPSTGASPAPNPRAARRAGCGARPGAVPRKVPAAAPRKLPAAGPSNKRDKYSRSPERRRTIKNPNRRAGGKRSPSHRNGGRSGGHKKRTGRRKDDETGCEEWSGEESSDYGDDSERSSEGTEVESQNECSENQQAGKESLGESWGVADNRVLGDSEESFKSLHSSDYSEMDLGSEDAGERRDSEELVYSDMEEWDGPSAVGQEPVDGFDKNTRKRERVDRRQQRRKQFMQQPGFRLEGGAAPGGDGGDDPGRGGRDNGSGRGDGSGRRDDDEDEKKKEADKKKAEEKKKKEAEEKKKKEAEEKKKKEAKDKEKREAEDKKEKEAQEEEKKAEPNKDMAEEKETEDKAEEKGSEDEAEEKKSEDKAEEKNEEDEDTEVGSQTDLAENNQSVKESLEDADKPEADTTGKKKDKRTSVSPSGPLKRRHNNDKDGKDDGDDAKPLPPKRARY